MDIKDQILQRLIKEHGIKSTKADFTNDVMQQLQEDWVSDVVLPVKPLNTTSADFTATVMGKVEALESNNIYKPILSKNLIITFFAVIAVLMLVGIYIKDDAKNTTAPMYNLSDFYTIAVVNLKEVVNALALLLVPICILLVSEYFYKKYITTRKMIV